MPALGMAQETGKLLRWLVAEGQPVAQGQPFMEIETDKVTVEIESPASGILAGIRARPGQEVPVGDVVAVVLAPNEPPPPASTETARAAAPLPPQIGRAPASPKARRLAQELGVDLATVAGSGPGGEISAADIMNAKGSSQASGALHGAVDSVWRVMADRLTRSWTTAPHFYLARDVSAARLVARRGQAGRLRPEDVAGGTFTISNLGMYGVDAFYPILNPPQAAILAVGRITDRVVAVHGIPAVQPMLTLTLSCDHRVVDGAGAAQFLDTLARGIETAGDAVP